MLPEPGGRRELPLPVPEGRRPLHACMLRFEPAARDGAPVEAALAEGAGIPWPETIARSVPSRQREYLMGRRAAALALAPWGRGDARVGTGERREPLWPAGLVGSISHVRGHAAAVAAPAADFGGLGIDLEFVARDGALAALRTLAVDADELALLEACAAREPSLSADALVTLAFSAKESLYKAASPVVRSFFGFEAARVRAVDPAAGRLRLEMAASPGGPFVAGSCWDVHFQPVERDAGLWLTSLVW